jgi:hypothetical protein
MQRFESGEFSVCQFFDDDTYEYVRQYVSAEEAMKAFQHYTNNVAVKMGIVKRVIITDGGDCIAAEWQLGKGVVFPTQADIEANRKGELQ